MEQEFDWKIDPRIATADETRFAMQVWCNQERTVVTESAVPTGETSFKVTLTKDEVKQITDTGDPNPTYIILALVPHGGISKVVKGYMEIE